MTAQHAAAELLRRSLARIHREAALRGLWQWRWGFKGDLVATLQREVPSPESVYGSHSSEPTSDTTAGPGSEG